MNNNNVRYKQMILLVLLTAISCLLAVSGDEEKQTAKNIAIGATGCAAGGILSAATIFSLLFTFMAFFIDTDDKPKKNNIKKDACIIISMGLATVASGIVGCVGGGYASHNMFNKP